jgi:hypothetical protein
MFQPQVHDGRDDAVFLERVGAFLGGLGGDHGEPVHLQELHERSSHRHVVFDDEHEAGGILCHIFPGGLGRTRPALHQSDRLAGLRTCIRPSQYT